MNRAQRRDFLRKAQKQGIKKSTAQAFISAREMGFSKPSPPKKFSEGDKITLDIESIKARKNWDKMSDAYKSFVQESAGVVFTAHVERENLISLAERPAWLFWSGDLIAAEPTEAEVPGEETEAADEAVLPT